MRTFSGVALRIGTSGYSYPHWRHIFYPKGLGTARWLGFYAERFDALELNATFYMLPRPGSAERWAQAVPGHFRFAVKGSRYLTHLKQLRDVDEGVRRFFDAVAGLGDKRGPVLWQLPPRMKPDAERLERFLRALPAGPHAVEFRSEAWLAPPVLRVLERAGAALCVHDLLDVDWPWPPPGPFVYLRFHGAAGRYGGRYGARRLEPWARRLQALRRDAWVFFNNDREGDAVHDAAWLRGRLS